MDRAAPPGRMPGSPVGPAGAPPRELLVRDFMTMGMSREQAEAQYDRQAARSTRGDA
jgi:hypothetical protein